MNANIGHIHIRIHIFHNCQDEFLAFSTIMDKSVLSISHASYTYK